MTASIHTSATVPSAERNIDVAVACRRPSAARYIRPNAATTWRRTHFQYEAPSVFAKRSCSGDPPETAWRLDGFDADVHPSQETRRSRRAWHPGFHPPRDDPGAPGDICSSTPCWANVRMV